MMLSLDTAYRSFGGEVEASSTPTICRLSDSHRHQLWAIAPWNLGREERRRDQLSHPCWQTSFCIMCSIGGWSNTIRRFRLNALPMMLFVIAVASVKLTS